MKATENKVFPALLLAFVIFLPCFSAPIPAEPALAGGRRLFLGAAAGYFYPGQGSFRELYEKPAWPFELRLGWALKRNLFFFGAARYLRTSGSTRLDPVLHGEETYGLRLQVLTLQLGLNYFFGQRRLAPFLGAGLQYASFSEKWQDLPIETQGGKPGFSIQAGGRYRLGRSWHALAQMEYSSLPAGNGAVSKVNLGGLNLSLGLMAGIL
jgi:hypothetical protein